MRHPFRASVILIAALMLASCASSPTINANYDHSADFSTYQTFGFFEPFGTDVDGYESLVSHTLKSAARSEMEKRGYTYQETGADLLLNFSGRLQQKTRITQDPMGPTYYGYRRGFYRGWNGYTTTQVQQYEQGTINVDMIDAKRQQMVWESVAVGRVSDKTRQNRAATLTSAVADMFAKFPFHAGK